MMMVALKFFEEYTADKNTGLVVVHRSLDKPNTFYYPEWRAISRGKVRTICMTAAKGAKYLGDLDHTLGGMPRALPHVLESLQYL